VSKILYLLFGHVIHCYASLHLC